MDQIRRIVDFQCLLSLQLRREEQVGTVAFRPPKATRRRIDALMG
jgi:hypothetical protein